MENLNPFRQLCRKNKRRINGSPEPLGSNNLEISGSSIGYCSFGTLLAPGLGEKDVQPKKPNKDKEKIEIHTSRPSQNGLYFFTYFELCNQGRIKGMI